MQRNKIINKITNDKLMYVINQLFQLKRENIIFIIKEMINRNQVIKTTKVINQCMRSIESMDEFSSNELDQLRLFIKEKDEKKYRNLCLRITRAIKTLKDLGFTIKQTDDIISNSLNELTHNPVDDANEENSDTNLDNMLQSTPPTKKQLKVTINSDNINVVEDTTEIDTITKYHVNTSSETTLNINNNNSSIIPSAVEDNLVLDDVIGSMYKQCLKISEADILRVINNACCLDDQKSVNSSFIRDTVLNAIANEFSTTVAFTQSDIVKCKEKMKNYRSFQNRITDKLNKLVDKNILYRKGKNTRYHYFIVNQDDFQNHLSSIINGSDQIAANQRSNSFEQLPQSNVNEEFNAREERSLISNDCEKDASNNLEVNDHQYVNDMLIDDVDTEREFAIPTTDDNAHATYEVEIMRYIEKVWYEMSTHISDYFGAEINPKIVNQLNELHERANRVPLNQDTVVLNTLKESSYSKEEQKLLPNDYNFFPIRSSASGVFRHEIPLIPSKTNSIAYAQLPRMIHIPLLAEHEKGDFLFERTIGYNNREHRLLMLTQTYLRMQTSGRYIFAAKALFAVFEHIVKLMMINMKSHRENIPAFITIINYELARLNLPPLHVKTKNEIETLIRDKCYELNLLPMLKGPFSKLDSTSRKPIKPYFGVDYVVVNGISIYWVMPASSTYQYGSKIDTLPANCIYINTNADVYNKATGELILTYRENVVSKDVIDEANVWLFATNKSFLMNQGSRKRRNKDGRKVSSEGAVGFLAKESMNYTSFIARHPFKYEIIETTNQIVKELEENYQNIAPNEFKKIKENTDDTFKIGDVTAAVSYNFDRQSDVHTDNNAIPGKAMVAMTVFWGSEKQRYTGGETVFTQFSPILAVNVAQGSVLVADTENNYHANVSIHFTDQDEMVSVKLDNKTIKYPNFHRISAVGYIQSSVLKKQRLVYLNSDDECDLKQGTNSPSVSSENNNNRSSLNTDINAFNNNYQPRLFSLPKNLRTHESKREIAKQAYMKRNNNKS